MSWPNDRPNVASPSITRSINGRPPGLNFSKSINQPQARMISCNKSSLLPLPLALLTCVDRTDLTVFNVNILNAADTRPTVDPLF